jgi:Spy/CpxP family protein refolding chaperone
MSVDGDSGVRPTRSRLMAVGVLLAVAVAGAAGGVLLDRTLLAPPPRPGRPSMGDMGRRSGSPSSEMRKRFSDRIAKELGLTPEQQVKVDSIMTRQFEGMRKASATVQPTIDSLVRAAQASMDSVLTPEQRTKVQEMRRRPRTRGTDRPTR